MEPKVWSHLWKFLQNHWAVQNERGWICTWMSMEVIVTIVSKLGYNLLKGLITYLYRGYNPVTKYQQDIPVLRLNTPARHLP